MRVSKEQAGQNRQQIVAAATRLCREQGVSATGVDTITKDVGLTHGGLYSQFGSKEAIAAEAIRLALKGSQHRWQRLAERRGAQNAFPAIVEQYLSPAQRDVVGQGCIIAALGGELARQPQSVRDACTEEFKSGLEFLAGVMPEQNASHRYDDAVAAFASMIGALILTRAVNDETLSERILRSTAKRVLQPANSRKPAQRSKGLRASR